MNDTVLSNDIVSRFFSGKSSITPGPVLSQHALHTRDMFRAEEERASKERDDKRKQYAETSPAQEAEEQRAAHAETVRAETHLGMLLLQGVNPIVAQSQASLLAPARGQKPGGRSLSAPRGLKNTLYVTHKSRMQHDSHGKKCAGLSAYFCIQATAANLFTGVFSDLSSAFSSAVKRCKSSSAFAFSHRCLTKIRAIYPC
jgi:hypothetical protein